MQEPTGLHQHQPSPHTARTCQLCASLRHPAMAADGRKLAKHLKANPFPRQAVTA